MACAHCKCAGYKTYAEAAASDTLFFCKHCDQLRKTHVPRASPISKQTGSHLQGLSASALSPLANPRSRSTPPSPVDSPSNFMTPPSNLSPVILDSQQSIPVIRDEPPPVFDIPPSPTQSSGMSSRDHDYAVPPLMSLDVPCPATIQASLSPLHPDIPSLDLVLATYVTTLNHIPRACRDSCCYTLSVLHSNIVNDPSIFNWSLLLLFPKTVLASPPRGRQNSRNLPSIMKDRLSRWSQGLYNSLWSETVANQAKLRRRKSHQTKNTSQQDFNSRRAEAKAQSGQFRNALQALSSEGLAEDTDEVIKILNQKPWPGTIPIPSEMIKSAILSFNTDTAPGPSGFRANYFKDLISSPNPNQRQRFFTFLTNLVNSMNRGNIPLAIRPFLFAATLHAAKKKQGGLRPIAIGDVYSRLTSKCLASLLAEEAVSAFSPLQLGIKVCGGCESVIHATATTFYSNTPPHERYILQVDLENTFNNADRFHFLSDSL